MSKKTRLSEDTKRILSTIIKEDLDNPIFSEFITIKDVISVRGGHLLTVFFTVGFSQSEEDRKKAEKVKLAFEKANGYIRGKITRALNLRRAPELRFEIDLLEENAKKIETLLNR